MNKPKLQTKAAYDYFDLKEYIISKYKDADNASEDTWEYMCNMGVSNGSYNYIPNTASLDNEFTKAVEKEFGNSVQVWISW